MSHLSILLHWFTADQSQHEYLTHEQFRRSVLNISEYLKGRIQDNYHHYESNSIYSPNRICLLSHSNTCEDLLIRCACLVLGWSTVTTNWQSDM